MFRYTVPYLARAIYPSLVWELPATGKEIYITFDDGPHPEITAWVCEQLKLHNANGSFFCVGENVQKYPDTYNALLAQGHSTGNHTFHHINGWANGDQEYLEDIKLCAEQVQSKLFRPPYGKIRPTQLKLLKSDYRIIMWSLLSRDFEANLDVSKALSALKKNTHPGSIIIFHDSEKAWKNLQELLPEYLQFCSEKGFEMKAIT